MTISHTSRQGKTYHLHQRTTKTGKLTYYASPKEPDPPVAEMPPGFEFYEDPNGRVYVRKVRHKWIQDKELALVTQALEEHPEIEFFQVRQEEKMIEVYTAGEAGGGLREIFSELRPDLDVDIYLAQLLRYSSELRFELVDPETRDFLAWRYCFLGSIDDWIIISEPSPLARLVAEIVPKLETDEFFELM